MEEHTARAESLELMKRAPAVYLATVGDGGFPQIRALLNLRNPDRFPGVTHLFDGHEGDFLIYLSTNTSSNKVRQIKANPMIALYYCLPEEWKGLMLCGQAEFTDDPKLKESVWQKGWEIYFPTGPTDPDFTIVRLSPESAVYYHSLDTAQIKLR